MGMKMGMKEIGTTIYLCEGTKECKNNRGCIERRIEVCNSNPKVIRAFMKYLRTFNINERKLRGRISLHEHSDEKKAKQYWSQITGMPINQFHKTQWRKSSNWFKRRLPYGTLAVRLNDVGIFRLILKEIELLFP
jgi:hypothetical protein